LQALMAVSRASDFAFIVGDGRYSRPCVLNH
jgi:hypothetical protein